MVIHPIDYINYRKVTLQFNDDGTILYIQCPYDITFINGIKSNLVKDEISYYEYDIKNKIWEIYSWGEWWPIQLALNLLMCIFPGRNNN